MRNVCMFVYKLGMSMYFMSRSIKSADTLAICDANMCVGGLSCRRFPYKQIHLNYSH